MFLKMETTSKKIMQPTTIKSKDNGCGTAPGNLVWNFKSDVKNLDWVASPIWRNTDLTGFSLMMATLRLNSE